MKAADFSYNERQLANVRTDHRYQTNVLLSSGDRFVPYPDRIRVDTESNDRNEDSVKPVKPVEGC
jgi:hypothetical protein